MEFPGAGGTLETVLLGCALDGLLRLWRSDGRRECRRVADADELTVLGRGALARTSLEPNRFREVALLDPETGGLVLSRRSPAAADAPDPVADGPVLATEAAAEPALTSSTWMEWGRRLSDIIVAAAQRGELVVVERGGWEVVRRPYVLASVLVDGDGGETSYVEALPAPTGDPWPPPLPNGSASLSAPASRETLSVAGILAAQAVSFWAGSPLDVVLTFVRPGTPDGSPAVPERT